MSNRFGTACRWLLVFCILLLHGFSYEQSPPEPSRSPRPSPRPPLPQLQPPPPLPEGFLQKFPLSLLSAALRLALCPLPERSGCVWQFSWVIDLPPFPLSNGAKSNTTGLRCIGTIGIGCRWQTITGYLAEESDTYVFAPLELHVQAQDISQMLMMGHTTFTGVLLRQLQVLSIACDNPLPVFAPYFLEPLIMALSAARVDAGVNVSAAVPAPPPSSPPGVSPSANYTSDAANASLASVGFSRLYAQPILASPQLRKLTINNCKLTGQLPRDTFWLQLPKLEHLDLSRNMLSGPLPATFGPSPPLSYMNLSYNRITGPLTSTHIRYGGCGRTLDLSYNDLRGGLPKQWLASACTLEDSVGLSPPRRRRLDEQVYDNWVGPEGGVKVADLRKNVRAATFKTSDSGHTGTSNETNLQASTDSGVDGAIAAVSSSTSGTTTSAAYAFWLSYPMSYSYGGDNCPSYGIAWDVPLASGVHNGTGGPDGIPFPFTVLLYGNPNLRYPGGKKAGYATAPSAYLHFSVRENACTAFDPLPEIVWLWGSFGVCTVVTVAISVIQALWVIRRMRAKVAPAGAAKGATSPSGAAGGTRKKAEVQEGERSTTRQGEASRPGKGQSATVTPSPAAGATGSGPSSTAPTNPPPTATVTVVPTSTAAMPPTTTTTATTTSGNDASASPAVDPVPTARPGSGSMARIIIVGHHARVYSRAAAKRLGVWGNAVLDVIEAFGEWFFLVIPWGHIIRTLVAFSVHVGSAGLTYVMSLPQRTAYCTTVMDCLPYLFFVPMVLSLLSMAVTLFLMRATHMLAGSMTQQLCGSAAGGPSAWGAGPWQPLGQGPPRGGGPSPTATLSEEQSDKNSNGLAAGANNAMQPAAAAEATLSKPERWISGLQPIRTVAATHRSPSPVGVVPNIVRASSQSKSTQGAAPPVAVALPTPRCLSNNSSTGTSGRSGGGGGAGSRNNNLSNLSGAAAASVVPAQRPDSPRAVAYVHGLGLGPPAGALAGPPAVVSSGPSTHLRPVAESIESGSGRVAGRQLSSRGVVAASRLTWQRHEPGVRAFDQEDGGWRSAGPTWSQRAHPANIIGRGGSGCGRGGSGGGGDEGFDEGVPHAGGCRSEPGAAREWESAGQLLPGRPGPVGEATEELEASAPAASGTAGTWPVLAREGTDTVTAPGADSRDRVSLGLMAPPSPTGLNTTGPDSVLEASAVLASSANSGIVMAPGAYPGATATWAGQMPAGSYSESNTNRMTPTVRAGGANPWLEDRLNALAVLTTSSMSLTAAAASPTPYADGTRRMPSNATAAAVAAAAAATPSWRRQPSPNNDTPSTSDTKTQATPATAAVTSPAGGVAPKPLTSQTRLNNLRHEALGVVNKFLYEYALGSPSTPWWPGRVGCITRSLALVLLCAVPIAPFAAILIVLAFFAVVAETVVRKVGLCARGAVRAARSSASSSCSPRFAGLRLTLVLFLGVHTHVAAWVLGIPLAFFTGVCYGLGYMWGQDAVPYPWVFLACNAACLAGVLLLLLELGYDLHTWERGVCRYPYEVAVRAAAVGPSGAGAQTQQRVVEA